MSVRIRLSLIAIAAVTPAAAQGLSGSDLGWQYYAGGGALAASVDGSVTSGEFIAGSGSGEFIEPTDGGPLPIFDIGATDTTISFDYSPTASASSWSNSPLSLTPTIYNGIAIDLLSSGGFEDVTVDPLTNMDGFGSGNISFTADQIQVNWEGLSFDSSTDVILDVTLDAGDPPATPEPATFVLLAPIFGGLLLARRRTAAN